MHPELALLINIGVALSVAFVGGFLARQLRLPTLVASGTLGATGGQLVAAAHLGAVGRIPQHVHAELHAGLCQDQTGGQDTLAAESGANHFYHHA